MKVKDLARRIEELSDFTKEERADDKWALETDAEAYIRAVEGSLAEAWAEERKKH